VLASQRSPPASRARRDASSAAASSGAASSPSSGKTATPTLAVIVTARSGTGKGFRIARTTFSAMRVASS